MTSFQQNNQIINMKRGKRLVIAFAHADVDDS
jgi:hypothetical protein